jgi:ATP-dependent helicase/nuclease subunit A
MSFDAVNPNQSSTVFASAGTGKTWQLVTRLLRLLLSGNEPGTILAVTFTRKAAGEMQQRLLQRLSEWSICDDVDLNQHLIDIGCNPDAALLQQARGLYEKVLLNPYPIRTTTFHSFCHDLLARFPREAHVAPGFELVEQTAEQQALAWEKLMVAADKQPQGTLALALEYLFDACNGVLSTRLALNNFLNQRSDWWAYIEDQSIPLKWAIGQLEIHFDITADTDETTLYQPFFTDLILKDLKKYAALLGCNSASPTNKNNANNLLSALKKGVLPTDAFHRIRNILLTKTDTPRALKASRKVITEIGEAQAERLLTLHQYLSDQILTTLDTLHRLNACRLNQAWLTAGSQYLEYFQDIKKQRRQLDFADLEWSAYRLLNTGDNALTVQYKLDQRINHLLIDEFQDTNPTQWRLIFPLLEEFAASAHDTPRTVFLVGDAKQSIYGFRRANPKLQLTAANWMQTHLSSHQVQLNTSYRSSSAIIDTVNTVFADKELGEQLPEFQTHSTHKKSLWGRIEILPLAKKPQASEPAKGLRNPLEQPLISPPSAAQIEAQQIAERIGELVNSHWIVGEGENTQALGYGDIKILLRQRTHAPLIEQALREAQIPFRGTARGALLGRLEIQDIRALLTVLATPQDNLALAQVLRSPLFAASNEDLITLAQPLSACWYERLQQLTSPQTSLSLTRAAQLLERWRSIGMTLPLHDLLDQIYHEGSVVARYHAAAQPWQRPQVLANLRRLLDLALEIDSGRYPSLTRFINRLTELERAGSEAPSEPTPLQGLDVVEMLTVHQSKGLEAAVIFFCNLAAKPQADKAWSTLVDWPADAERPHQFLLQPRSNDIDSVSQKARDTWKKRQQTESANLLYVALTRAKHMLVLSANETTPQKQENRYQQLKRLLEPLGCINKKGIWLYQKGDIPISTQNENIAPQATVEIHPNLRKPFALPHSIVEIAPSKVRLNSPQHLTEQQDNFKTIHQEDNQPRGVAIHRFLELLSSPHDWQDSALLFQVSAELDLQMENSALISWLDEAKTTLQCFPKLFSGDYLQALNEVPILFNQEKKQVYGIIDRLLIFPDKISIIDYKTHRLESSEIASELIHIYRPQLAYYATGIQRIYPSHRIETSLLLTHLQQLQIVDLEKEAS